MPLMIRSYDPEELSSRRYLLDDNLVGFDPESIVLNKDNILLVDGGDAILFERHGPAYAGHLLLTSKGKKAFEVAREALKYIEGKPCFGLTPVTNKKALWFTRQLGFERIDIVETPVGDAVLSMYKESSNECHLRG